MGHKVGISDAEAVEGSCGEEANHQRTDRAGPAAERRADALAPKGVFSKLKKCKGT